MHCNSAALPSAGEGQEQRASFPGERCEQRDVVQGCHAPGGPGTKKCFVKLTVMGSPACGSCGSPCCVALAVEAAAIYHDSRAGGGRFCSEKRPRISSGIFCK